MIAPFNDSNQNLFWLCLGFASQGLFAARFLIQWISSEINKKSVIPISFWYFSILGGISMLSYSIYKKDPVFITGQSLGIIVYLRNLYLIRKKS
jgi:lipid-A-disaccharide synthase-like uncharacterized protein